MGCSRFVGSKRLGRLTISYRAIRDPETTTGLVGTSCL
jgi:hypothetical protein